MSDSIRDSTPERRVDAAHRRRPADPLFKTVVLDLLITTGGFLLMVVAVVLTAQGLSLN
jgi:hypothetical protein